jgi:hypothetical protein
MANCKLIDNYRAAMDVYEAAKAGLGAEGPSAQNRTAASCTQCPGSGQMRQCAVDQVRNRRHAIAYGSVLHAKSSPALGPQFAACNTSTAAATSRPFQLARTDCTQ